MPPYYEVAVAQFGDSSSQTKQWAIAVIFTPAAGHAMIYRVVSSSSGYSLRAPESVTLLAGQGGYLGKVSVGRVDHERMHQFSATIAKVPIIQNDPSWRCENWVVDGLTELQGDGHYIDEVSHSSIARKLGRA